LLTRIIDYRQTDTQTYTTKYIISSPAVDFSLFAFPSGRMENYTGSDLTTPGVRSYTTTGRKH